MKTRLFAAITLLGALAVAPIANAQSGGNTLMPQGIEMTQAQQAQMQALAKAIKRDKAIITQNAAMSPEQKGEAMKTLLAQAMQVINAILTPEQRAAMAAAAKAQGQ